MKLVIAVVLAGCTNFDDPWPVRAGMSTQSITRADLGLADDADITIDALWVSLHAFDETDVAYPIVDAGGGRLFVASPFDPIAGDPRGALVTLTRPQPDMGSRHGHDQYATLFVDVQLADHLRDRATGPLASGLATFQLELEVPVGKTCDAPPDHVNGTIDGDPLVRRDDGAYIAGPFALTIAIESQMCVE
jgi:hypothetical protein